MLLWKDKKRAGALALTTNLFFVLVCLFGYSAFSLILLFVIFISMIGIMLHLFYNATSDDDHDRSQVSVEGEAAQYLTTIQDTEFVSLDAVLKAFLFLYEMAVRIRTFHNDIVTFQSPEMSLVVLPMLTLGFLVSWLGNVSTEVWLWLLSNAMLFYLRFFQTSDNAVRRRDKFWLPVRNLARRLPKLK